jgi:hypothetical protein
MASLLLGFHRNMPTLKPIALSEFSETEIGLAAAWANGLDQVKALVDRAVGLYQTFYTEYASLPARRIHHLK